MMFLLITDSKFKEKHIKERWHSTFRSAPAQKTLGTELQIIKIFAEESLLIASKLCCNSLSMSFPMAFLVAGLSKLTSTIPANKNN